MLSRRPEARPLYNRSVHHAYFALLTMKALFALNLTLQALAEQYIRALPESVKHAKLVVWPESVG
jgi:hypothetical protein